MGTQFVTHLHGQRYWYYIFSPSLINLGFTVTSKMNAIIMPISKTTDGHMACSHMPSESHLSKMTYDNGANVMAVKTVKFGFKAKKGTSTSKYHGNKTGLKINGTVKLSIRAKSIFLCFANQALKEKPVNAKTEINKRKVRSDTSNMSLVDSRIGNSGAPPRHFSKKVGNRPKGLYPKPIITA